MDKTTLIISDIHHRWAKAEKIIALERPKKIIFVGDYFDDWNDTVEMTKNTALWLKESLKQKNRVHIFGNHDLSLFYDTIFTQCSGFTYEKHKTVREIIDDQDIKKFKFYYWLDENTLVSHAGLTSYFIESLSLKHSRGIKNFLKYENSKAWLALNNQRGHWFFMAGRARGGVYPKGGLTWCDFNREFEPIPSINQIFGHTEAEMPRYIESNKGLTKTWNYCIDTRSNHYVVWNGEKILVKDVNLFQSKH